MVHILHSNSEIGTHVRLLLFDLSKAFDESKNKSDPYLPKRIFFLRREAAKKVPQLVVQPLRPYLPLTS